MVLVLLFLTALFINFSQHGKGDELIEVFRWKQMDFYNRGDSLPQTGMTNSGAIIFPDLRRGKRDVTTSRDHPMNTNQRSSFDGLSSGNSNSSSYIPYNNVPMGATYDTLKGRLFVTMPRRRIGIPSTLNYIDMRKDGRNQSPKLVAYPDFETNQLDPNFRPNPNRIVSVYRTSIDACKRLWFIDTGMLEYPDNRMQVQRPAIWLIDTTTDRVVRRFEIPQSVVDTGRGLASITVDAEQTDCGRAFAYIPDLVNSQLFVYSLYGDRMWAFSHNYFNFDPLAGDLSIGGQTFRWDDGIFSATLGPRDPYTGYRNLYFHAMASNNEFLVSNQVLQNEANAARTDHGQDFRLVGSRGRRRQSTMHEYDPRTGVIFYDEIQRNGVGCWNTKRPLVEQNMGTVAQDAQRMIYPSDLTIDAEGTMWVMTNSMPVFIYSSLDPNTFNFRVWKQNVFTAVKNTICE